MREKYHTEALILKVTEYKESNLLYHILSKEFGFIIATAQSTRLLRSKLRFGLQDFSVADISVVRTGDVWKITNAVPRYNIFFEIDKFEERQILARIAQFLRRFLNDEQTEPNIYEDTITATNLLQSGQSEGIEEIFVLRGLYHLGLLKENTYLRDTILGKSFEETVAALTGRREEVLGAINESLKESQI